VAGIVLVLSFMAAQAYAAAEFDLNDIDLPKGFVIEEYAAVPNARSLALGDDGVVFVGNRRAKSVYAVVPRGDAEPDVVELVSDLEMPNGIAYHEGDLYVAEISRILVYRNVMSQLYGLSEPEVLDIELPGERHHGWRYIGFGPDGKLYIAVGAPCNVCDRDAEGFAQIWRTNADGSGKETFARGIRNSVGFTWHPQTGDLWFTDNGRDMLGDDLPPDELNVASRTGMHFGYPYCHGGDFRDPEFGADSDCSEFVPPVQKLGPHVAALGVKFYTGKLFPDEYRGQMFIAEHGSWNRSKKIGYRVMLVTLEDGIPAGYSVFADGWLKQDEVSGRPVDLLVMPDGSMLVSDDYGGRLFRISYEDNQASE
jgi:glucose/arabinose dehydrogenase